MNCRYTSIPSLVLTSLLLVVTVGANSASAIVSPVQSFALSHAQSADDIITQKIHVALTQDEALVGINVVVAVNEGKVRLTGMVSSLHQHDQIILLASGIEGLREISDLILINSDTN